MLGSNKHLVFCREVIGRGGVIPGEGGHKYHPSLLEVGTYAPLAEHFGERFCIVSPGFTTLRVGASEEVELVFESTSTCGGAINYRGRTKSMHTILEGENVVEPLQSKDTF